MTRLGEGEVAHLVGDFLPPVWAHSGQELFFVDDGGSLVAAQINTEQGFRVGEKETLFRLPPGFRTSEANTLFGVAPDDQRFLMARVYQADSQGSADSGFVLVNNFFEELRTRVGN